MTTPQLITEVSGVDAMSGMDSATWLRCRIQGVVARRLGLDDQPVQIEVQTSAWPGGFDASGELRLRLGFDTPLVDDEDEPIDDSPIVLGRYLVTRIEDGLRDADSGERVTTRLTLSLTSAFQRRGRGGIITAIASGTGERPAILNPVDRTGRVDTASDDYRSVRELALIAIQASGFDGTVPTSIDTARDGSTTITAPGPLDWGNARALDELDALLSYVGWRATQSLDGNSLLVTPLAIASKPVTLPAALEAVAEPYTLSAGRPSRGTRVVVSSGSTRTTVITQRTLPIGETGAGLGGMPALRWVGYDVRTGRWLDAAAFASLYPTEDAPGDIAAFRAGPVGPDAEDGSTSRAKTHGRLFTAVALDADEVGTRGRFVALPEAVELSSDYLIAAAPAKLYAIGARIGRGQVLENEPSTPAEDPPALAAYDELAAISGEGVFRLPSDLVWARVDGADTGSYADTRELTGEELTIVFSHESASGVYLSDYYVAAYDITADAMTGDLIATPLEDEDLDAAIADPMAVRLDIPWLRLIAAEDSAVVTDPEDPPRTDLNRAALDAISAQIALHRGAADDALTGTIVLRGFHGIAPGDLAGAVSSVTWDLAGGATVLSINQHERPASTYAALEAAAGRSVVDGLTGRTTPSSRAGQRDVARGAAQAAPASPGPEPESRDGTRGRESAVVGSSLLSDAAAMAPAPKRIGPEYRELLARITGSMAVSGEVNQWEYEWEQVHATAPGAYAASGVTSATHAKARNLAEAGNTAIYHATGVDPDNLPSGILLKPIPAGRVVMLAGPVQSDPTTRHWEFSATNHYDGDCGGGS